MIEAAAEVGVAAERLADHRGSGKSPWPSLAYLYVLFIPVLYIRFHRAEAPSISAR